MKGAQWPLRRDGVGECFWQQLSHTNSIQFGAYGSQGTDLIEIILYGGARRDRTADLYNAIVALSQLSYSPISRGREG